MQNPEKPEQKAANSIFLCSAQNVTEFVTSAKIIINAFINVFFEKEEKMVIIAEKKHIHAHIEIIAAVESEMLSVSIRVNGFVLASVFSLRKTELFLFFNKTARVKSARMFAIKILTPMPISPKKQEPVRVTEKAKPGFTQKRASFCASLRVIDLFL